MSPLLKIDKLCGSFVSSFPTELYGEYIIWSDIQKWLHKYLASHWWLLERVINNLHYIPYVKLFRLIKEENDLMKSSFEGSREHFMNLRTRMGETCNFQHGLPCTLICFSVISYLTTETSVLVNRLWPHIGKTDFWLQFPVLVSSRSWNTHQKRYP